MGHPQPLPAIIPGLEAGKKEAPSGFLAIEDRGRLDALGQHVRNLWLEGVPT
jgi:hypothetical protein